jgi:transposase InsO family protein
MTWSRTWSVSCLKAKSWSFDQYRFDQILRSVGVKPVRLPPHSPNLNAYCERWIRSVKSECLSKLILFGEWSLRHALDQYILHHGHERNP